VRTLAIAALLLLCGCADHSRHRFFVVFVSGEATTIEATDGERSGTYPTCWTAWTDDGLLFRSRHVTFASCSVAAVSRADWPTR
jgi:hypothetical protein